ncbi:hypothetical protein LguiA_005918 [Lonicera macranthoides]
MSSSLEKNLALEQVVEGKKKFVTLKSSDEQEFIVEESVAVQSDMIKNIIEDCGFNLISLPNVNGKTLYKVMQYCTKHTTNYDDDDDEFLDVDQSIPYDLLMAANYLNIKDLLEKICEKIASMIEGKSVEEIRKTFEIENDFEPEQEKEIRSENPWAFA